MNHLSSYVRGLTTLTSGSMLLGILLSIPAAAADRGPATDPSIGSADRILEYDGQPVRFEAKTDRFAVVYFDASTPAERIAAANRLGLPARSVSTESLPMPAIEVFQLQTAAGVNELRELAAAARREPSVASASPVYNYNGVDVYPTGQIFVQLADGLSEVRLDELAERFGLNILERTSWKSGNYVCRATNPDIELLELCAEMSRVDGVEFAEPDMVQRLTPFWTATDPYFPQQWSLNNLGVSPFKRDCDIDAPEAWEIVPNASAVTIAILDEGCQIDHPDYTVVGGWDMAGNDSDASPMSWDSHGTKCAGVAAAKRDNVGVAGVASGAKVMPIRIAYSPYSGAGWVTTTAWLAGGISWAYLNGADVLSNSWGGGSPSYQMREAIRGAVLDGRGGLGALVCFAAGNNDYPVPSYPSTEPETICVAATTPCDVRKQIVNDTCQIETWWGSNYGIGTDVAAPGVGIPTTTVGSGYVTNFNGTSSATPHVAGVAGLLVAKFPTWKGTEIRARLESTCDKVGPYSYDALAGVSFELGHGRINAYRALSGKPMIRKNASGVDPSLYSDWSDAQGAYPIAEHNSAAYEWLGEEFSNEVLPGMDADGPSNTAGRDNYDDGVRLQPPYIPGQLGQVTVTVSVEDHNSPRYAVPGDSLLFVNVWMDWESDDNWNVVEDWVVQNKQVNPSTWGSNTQSFTYSFIVPDNPIFWNVQSAAAAKFFNVRTRVSRAQRLTTPSERAKWGEVEDDRIVNFVEMFDVTPNNTTLAPTPCITWDWLGGPQPWLPGSCPPLFPIPDPGWNGFMCLSIYHPAYSGDEFDGLRTASFDLSEMTEAYIEFDHSGIEFIHEGRVVVYVNGLAYQSIAHYQWIPTTSPACAQVLHEHLDLTAYCGQGFNDVVIALEGVFEDPCGTTFPNYMDWFVDNIVVVAEDKIAPDAVSATATPVGPNETVLTWTAPGDDAQRDQAQLYNIRYAPYALDATTWRHGLWLRQDMTTPLPVPAPPGTVETIDMKRLAGGMHHFSVRTYDEVNNQAGLTDAGMNQPPTVIAVGPYTIYERQGFGFNAAATDPDFDPLVLWTSQKPTAARFFDYANGTGFFNWLPGHDDIGTHVVKIKARDWNGAEGEASITITVLADPAPGRGACCMLTPGCCQIKTLAECALQAGSFLGVGSDCDPNPCAPAGVHHDAHDNGGIKLTMTDRGTLGFLDATLTQGLGLRYPATSQNQLYIGGLWVGNGGFVANRDFDADWEKDWFVSTCPDGQVRETINGTKQILTSRFSDELSINPRGIMVEQESWSYSSPGSDDDFVIVRYTISNIGPYALNGMCAAMLLDLDLAGGGTGSDDMGSTDASRKMTYIYDSSNTYVGLRTLDWNGALPVRNLTLIPNPTFVYPQQYIDDQDKIPFLVGGYATHSIADAPVANDYSALVSIGTFNLAPGTTRDVVFAIMGGTSLATLQQNSDRAQAVWSGSVTTDVDDTVMLVGTPTLLANAPNPFADQTALRFALPGPSNASLSVVDAAGRLVRRFEVSSATGGLQSVSWDGRDASGRSVGSGIYFVKLSAPGREESRPIVLAR